MKIAFVTTSISRSFGGLYDACRRLAQSMNDEDCNIQVFGATDQNSSQDKDSWLPVRVNTYTSIVGGSLAWAPGISRGLKAFSPDIIHSHGLWNYPSFIANRWRKKLQAPEIIHPHGMLDPWALRHSGGKKTIASFLFERAHLQRSSCIRALNLSEYNSIRKIGIRTPVCIIPNGVDLPDLNSKYESKLAHNKKHKTLLYLGRIHPKKGLPQLVIAWSLFRQQNPETEWDLAIAGWDQDGHVTELQVLASELQIPWLAGSELMSSPQAGASGAIHFLGPKIGCEKDALFRMSDAFILPSLSEGQPMVVLEAWAYSKPVLMTSMCNIPEGFVSGAAFLIEPEQNNIAEALKRTVATHPQELIRMGAAGRKLVECSFTWDQVGAQHRHVNEWLLKRNSCPDFVIT